MFKHRNEEGATAVEYGLLVALIAAVAVLAVISLGGLINGTFQETCQTIDDNSTASVTPGCTP